MIAARTIRSVETATSSSRAFIAVVRSAWRRLLHGVVLVRHPSSMPRRLKIRAPGTDGGSMTDTAVTRLERHACDELAPTLATPSPATASGRRQR